MSKLEVGPGGEAPSLLRRLCLCKNVSSSFGVFRKIHFTFVRLGPHVGSLSPLTMPVVFFRPASEIFKGNQ